MSAFVEDPQGIRAILEGAEMRVLLLDKAKDVVKLAGTLAAHDSGHYARTLKASSVEPGKARARSDDIAGHLIEFGGPKNMAQAPLRRAADVVCDGFQAAPKP